MKIQEVVLKLKVFCLFLVSLFCIGYVLISLQQKLNSKDFFILDYPEVIFEGNVLFDTDEAISQIKVALGEVLHNPTTYSVDVSGLKDSLGALAWIKNVAVVKEYPSSLTLVIEPKKIIAYMLEDGAYYPVDNYGNILPIKTDYVSGVIVTGERVNENLVEFLQLLDNYPRIIGSVVGLQYVNGLRWNLVLYDFSDGLVIKLSEEDVKSALDKIEELDAKSDLLKRNIAEIDIRDISRMLIKKKGL